jgi:tryptophan-rich sensory protein
MLTMPHPTEEEQALLTVAGWGSRWTRTRTLLSIVAAMHLLGAFTLLAAPDSQLFTQGARPAFDLFPPFVWALLFLAGGIGAATLLHRYTGPRQFVTWLFVIPAQCVWVGASAFAVLGGHGGAMSMVFLPALLAYTTVTALWVFWDFVTGKR